MSWENFNRSGIAQLFLFASYPLPLIKHQSERNIFFDLFLSPRGSQVFVGREISAGGTRNPKSKRERARRGCCFPRPRGKSLAPGFSDPLPSPRVWEISGLSAGLKSRSRRKKALGFELAGPQEPRALSRLPSAATTAVGVFKPALNLAPGSRRGSGGGQDFSLAREILEITH